MCYSDICLHEQEEEYAVPYHWFWAARAYCATTHFLQHLPPLPLQGLHVLDVGCGDGLVSWILSDQGCEVVGIDYSDAALRWAQIIVPNAEFHHIDITQEFSLGRRFDLILMREVLEHIPPEKIGVCLENVLHHMNKGGYFMLSVPANSPPISKHFQHFTVDALRKLLEPFFSIQFTCLDYAVGPIAQLFLWLCSNKFYRIPWFRARLDRHLQKSPMALRTSTTLIVHCRLKDSECA